MYRPYGQSVDIIVTKKSNEQHSYNYTTDLSLSIYMSSAASSQIFLTKIRLTTSPYKTESYDVMLLLLWYYYYY